MEKEYTTKNVFEHPMNEDAELQEAFTEFLNMRKKIRKPATDRAIKNLLLTLINLSEGEVETAIKIIDRSITNCWLDFYQLKEETSTFEKKSEKPIITGNRDLN